MRDLETPKHSPTARLDCSTVETAISSMSAVLGLPQDRLRRTLSTNTVDFRHSKLSSGAQLLGLLRIDSDEVPVSGAVRWFHATRVAPTTTFERGLLPTPAALEVLWPELASLGVTLVGATAWSDFRSSFSRGDDRSSAQFRRKQESEGWDGPFAFLVKEAALSCRNGGDEHKDFTACPEVLEDIFGSFELRFREPLRAAYLSLSRPCLVAFTVPGSTARVLEAALSYIYFALHDLEPAQSCNTCFSGEGKAVPRECFDYVEWLDPTGEQRNGLEEVK